jgi:uncharacterized damage-inducible protein DinB
MQRLIEFKNWADEIYIDYCQKLPKEKLEWEIEGYNNSIKKILNHLYEVYWSWLKFITDQNYDDQPEFTKLTIAEIIEGIRDHNKKILEYVQNEDLSKQFTIQWNENHKPVITTAANVIFNYITHSAYHRGQLAIYLLGVETIEETDFNPYIYMKGQA